MRNLVITCIATGISFLAIDRLKIGAPAARADEQLPNSARLVSGGPGKFQIMAARNGVSDTVYRIDTQTGQVWRLEDQTIRNKPGGYWIAMPQDVVSFKEWNDILSGK